MSGVATDPASERPIGAPVESHPAEVPQRITLSGRFVRLEPLDVARHGESIWRETHGPTKESIWQYLFEAPFADREAFFAHLERKSQLQDPLFFAIVNQKTGEALGYSTLMRIDAPHRCIEVGNIVYGARLQRTPGATDAQFLLMRYVFDTLGYRRYEWKCNSLNAASRAAALRYGFRFEGIFRQHMIVRGRNRDTAWHSIIDAEWPVARAAFEAWLSPANFDELGQQKRGLAELRHILSGTSVGV